VEERKPSSYYAVEYGDFKVKKARIPNYQQEEYKKT
jgi:hypothetical protein